MLSINGKMSEFERCMYISERLKCEKNQCQRMMEYSVCIPLLGHSVTRISYCGSQPRSWKTSILGGGEGDWGIHTVADLPGAPSAAIPLVCSAAGSLGWVLAVGALWQPPLELPHSNKALGDPTPCQGQALMEVRGISRFRLRGVLFPGSCYMEIRSWPDSIT